MCVVVVPLVLVLVRVMMIMTVVIMRVPLIAHVLGLITISIGPAKNFDFLRPPSRVHRIEVVQIRLKHEVRVVESSVANNRARVTAHDRALYARRAVVEDQTAVVDVRVAERAPLNRWVGVWIITFSRI